MDQGTRLILAADSFARDLHAHGPVVLLIQDEHPEYVPAVLSTKDQYGQKDHLARFVPHWVRDKQVFLLADVAPLCFVPTSHVTCVSSADGVVLAPNVLVLVEEGVHLHVNIERTPDSTDETVCMQLPVSSGDDITPSDSYWETFDAFLESTCWTFYDLQIWFVDHIHMPICRQYRLLQIEKSKRTWKQQVLDIWRDQINPEQPIFVQFADAVFLCPGTSRSNVLLWQNPMLGRVTALSVSCNTPFAAKYVSLSARSVPDSLLAKDLIEHSSWDESATVPKEIWFQNRERAPTDFLALYDGVTWTLGLAEMDPDHVTLMQLHSQPSSSHQISTPPGNLTREAGGRPGSQSRHGMVLAMVRENWALLAQPNSQGKHFLNVMTAFLSPSRQPVCSDLRMVQLTEDMNTWAQTMLQAWPDMLLPDEPVSIYFVYPQPLADIGVSPPAVYVLIVQDEVPEQRAVFFTTSHLNGRFAYRAACVDRFLQKAPALAAAGIRNLCDDVYITCSIHHGADEITNAHWWRTENGQGFLISVLTIPVPAATAQICGGSAPVQSPTVLSLEQLLPGQDTGDFGASSGSESSATGAPVQGTATVDAQISAEQPEPLWDRPREFDLPWSGMLHRPDPVEPERTESSPAQAWHTLPIF